MPKLHIVSWSALQIKKQGATSEDILNKELVEFLYNAIIENKDKVVLLVPLGAAKELSGVLKLFDGEPGQSRSSSVSSGSITKIPVTEISTLKKAISVLEKSYHLNTAPDIRTLETQKYDFSGPIGGDMKEQSNTPLSFLVRNTYRTNLVRNADKSTDPILYFRSGSDSQTNFETGIIKLASSQASGKKIELIDATSKGPAKDGQMKRLEDVVKAQTRVRSHNNI